MILQKLIEYSKTLNVPPEMYEPTPIKYVFELDERGKYISSSVLDGGRKNNDSGKILNAPTQSNQKGAKLLVGNAEFVFGIPKEKGSDIVKVLKRHEEFIKLIEKCESEVDDPDITAILKFYQRENYQNIFDEQNFDPTMRITFRVNGIYPFHSIDVQDFWAKQTIVLDRKETIKCHICGDKPAAERMPTKIKGIPYSKATVLISANKNAYESFGLKASKVCPTCRECAEKFTFALNHLLSVEDSHLIIGKQVYVFWSKGEEFSPVKALYDPTNFFSGLPDLGTVDDPARVKEMFKSAFGGRKGAINDYENVFYAAALSASKSRAVIRDWFVLTIPVVKENLEKYFFKTRIITKDNREKIVWPFKLSSLSGATIQKKKNKPDWEKLHPNTVTYLLNVALKGGRLPEDMLYQAVQRAKAEQTITAPRAALIKLYFMSNNQYIKEDDYMHKLNPNNKEPAYLCGRLLAVLEEVQSAALGNPNATIVDRYYGTASTAPATVFSTLMTGTRHHLAKLRKEKPGYHIKLERKIQEIAGGLSEFPKVLSLEEQGLFALGYYHQKQERFQSKQEKEIV